MMRKWSSIAKFLRRNFSSSAGAAPILQKQSFWKHTETAKNLATGSFGLVGGYAMAVATCNNRSQYVIQQEKSAMGYNEVTKKLIRKKAELLRELEGKS